MTYPVQVRKQIEQVEEHYKKADEVAPQSPEVVAEPAKPAEPAVTKDTQPAETSNEVDQLRQRYKTLQGMYNAEIPRWRAKVEELNGTIAAQAARISQLEQAASKPTNDPVDATYVTEDDKREFGDAIEVMRRAAREEAARYEKEIKDLKDALNEIRGVVPQVQSLQNRSEAEKVSEFWRDLAQAVPDFREVNEDPAFKEWLMEYDPVLRQNRDQVLKHAQQQLDASWVADFFTQWKRLNAPTTTPTVQPQPKPDSSNPSKILEAHVAPGPSRASSPAQEPKIITSEQIKQFYKDVVAGEYKGRENEKARIEADIFAAKREGRITT